MTNIMKLLFYALLLVITNELVVCDLHCSLTEELQNTSSTFHETNSCTKRVFRRSAENIDEVDSDQNVLQRVLRKSVDNVHRLQGGIIQKIKNWFKRTARTTKRPTRRTTRRTRRTTTKFTIPVEGWVRFSDIPPPQIAPWHTTSYGSNSRGQRIYVGRALAPNGDVIPGYHVRGQHCLYIEGWKQGRCILDFELLLGTYTVYDTKNKDHHPDGIVAGKDGNGALGICYRWDGGSLYVGKLALRSGLCLYAYEQTKSRRTTAYKQILADWSIPWPRWRWTRPPRYSRVRRPGHDDVAKRIYYYHGYKFK